MDIAFDVAEKAINATGAKSMEDALEYWFSTPMPSTVSYTPSQQPAPAAPRAIVSSIPAPVSAFIQEPENPYENDTFDLPELSVYRSSDTWITDEDEDDYYEMVQDTA